MNHILAKVLAPEISGELRTKPAEEDVVAASNLVDWSVALEAVAGDEDLLKDVVEAFLGEVPRQIAAAQEAIGRGDHVALRRAAHTLKGNSRYFGAREMYDQASQLESLAVQGEFAAAEEIRTKLVEAMARLAPVLLHYVGRNRP